MVSIYNERWLQLCHSWLYTCLHLRIHYTEPTSVTVTVTDISLKTVNISWSPPYPPSQDIHNMNYNLSVTSSNTRSQNIPIRESYTYDVFRANSDAPPCEVYNFSVTATYVGATYTGDGCSVPSPVISRMLPSLPDIEILESSLNYSLEKLSNGVVLTTTFQVRLKFKCLITNFLVPHVVSFIMSFAHLAFWPRMCP